MKLERFIVTVKINNKYDRTKIIENRTKVYCKNKDK